MTGSLTRANALPPPMSPSLASSLAPCQKPETNAWLVTTFSSGALMNTTTRVRSLPERAIRKSLSRYVTNVVG